MTRFSFPTDTSEAQIQQQMSPPAPARPRSARRLARMLGWFSIGLGAAEVLAPEKMAELTGVRRPMLLRAFGVREIATGIGLLASHNPTPWMWARVCGDALDLAALGEPLSKGRKRRRKRALSAMAAVAGVTALDIACCTRLTMSNREEDRGMQRSRKKEEFAEAGCDLRVP